MAEIRVEPKHNKTPIWPWIIGLLLLVGLIWIVAETFDGEEAPEVAAVETPILEEEPVANRDATSINELAPVNEYVTYVGNDAVSAEMGLAHNYTSEALQKLQAALAAIAEDQDQLDPAIRDEIAKLENVANRIQTDPQSLQHANLIQEAFISAATVMDALQENYFADLDDEVTEVQRIANMINVNEPTLEQKDQVKQFFEASAEAVRAMADDV